MIADEINFLWPIDVKMRTMLLMHVHGTDEPDRNGVGSEALLKSSFLLERVWAVQILATCDMAMGDSRKLFRTHQSPITNQKSS